MIALLLIPSIAPSPGRVRTLAAMATAMRSPGGPEILIASELRDEAIYLRNAEGDPARLRTLVARAVAAEWSEERGGLRLARSAALRRRLRAEDRAALGAGLKDALARMVPMTPLDAEGYRRLWSAAHPKGADASGAGAGLASSEAQREARAATYRALDPNERAFAYFGARVDPARLVEALIPLSGSPESGKVPRETIRLLGRGGGPYRALPLDGAAFLAAQRADLAVMATTPVERGPTDPLPPDEAESGTGGPDEREPAEVALDVRRSAARAGGELGVLLNRWPAHVSVSMYAVDPEGIAAWLGGGSIDLTPPEASEPLWPQGNSDRALAPAPNEGRELARRLSDARMERKPGEGVEEIEPLDTLARPMLDALSEGETRPIVLDLPDDLASLAYVKVEPVESGREGGPVREVARTMGEVRADLRRSVAIEVGGDAVVGRAREPLDATACRFPRAELRAWWRAAHDPTLSVDAAAALATRIGFDPTATFFEGWTLATTDGRLPRSPTLAFESDRLDLMLWRALPTAARGVLARGGTIETRALPAEAARLVEVAMANDNAPASFLARNGSPRLAVKGELKRVPVAILADPEFGIEAFEGEDLGRRFLEEEPAETGESSLRTARFRVGEQARQQLHIVYVPNPALSADLWLFEVTASKGEPVGWERLPPAILGPLRETIGDGER